MNVLRIICEVFCLVMFFCGVKAQPNNGSIVMLLCWIVGLLSLGNAMMLRCYLAIVRPVNPEVPVEPEKSQANS